MPIMDDPLFIESQKHFGSPRFSLCEESYRLGEAVITRPVIHHPGAVAVLAQPNPATLLLVRQFRYPIRRWTLEIPAGTRELGEEPLLTAQRELCEEAGYAAAQWSEMLRFYPAIGVSDEEMILYAASDLSLAPGTPDEGELVAAEIVSLCDCRELFSAGHICDAKTMIAIGILLGPSWCVGVPLPC